MTIDAYYSMRKFLQDYTVAYLKLNSITLSVGESTSDRISAACPAGLFQEVCPAPSFCPQTWAKTLNYSQLCLSKEWSQKVK
jgi:hypothetical protein